MEPNLFKYVWKHTRQNQVWVLFIVLASMPTYFLALDLPKRIVNGPIQGRGFEEEATREPFLRIAFDVPEWLSSSGTLEVFGGFALDRFGTLLALSVTFLLLVCVNGLFKFYINTYKGQLGERMLRRLRYDLIDRVLRFPMGVFKRVKPSEVATMIKDEVEPLGGFIGDAFVNPVFLGGQAITAMGFILLQNVWLGLVAAGIIAAQMVLIPRLRRRLIELGRQRQLAARALSGRVGEMVEGIANVHVNDTSHFERALLSRRLGDIFAIRYELFRRKFFVKFLNNFLAQMTPFLFYSVGGYFALTGRLDIGQLVAVIAAYKDVPPPIKELIDWDQQRLDVQVKYTQVIDQFNVDDMIDARVQAPVEGQVDPLTGAFKLTQVAAVDDSGARLIERLTATLELKERVALVGALNSGAEYISDILARLLPPTSGQVELAGRELETLPYALTGRRLGYVPADTTLYDGTVRQNLVYPLQHVPLREVPDTPERARQKAWRAKEARLTGGSPYDIDDDWIDYAAAGATGPDDLLVQIKRVLELVGMDEEILHLGLRGVIDAERHPELVARILTARNALRQTLTGDEHEGLVEVFDPARYADQATVGENLLFGTPTGEAFANGNPADHPTIREVLISEKLEQPLFEMGREIASTTVELFADLPPDHPFFEQLGFMEADDIPFFQTLLNRIQGRSFADADNEARDRMIALSFLYIEPRHRMSLLDDDLKTRIVKARRIIRERLASELAGAIEFYDPAAYNRAGSIQDNILFGRIAYGVAGGQEQVLALILRTLDAHDLHDGVFEVGLDFAVGSGGKRLSQAQRQRLSLARALLKRPDCLIVNRALSALDRDSQAAVVDRVLKAAGAGDGGFGVIWALANPEMADGFDRVIVMDEGKVAEDGPPKKLKAGGGVFAKLID